MARALLIAASLVLPLNELESLQFEGNDTSDVMKVVTIQGDGHIEAGDFPGHCLSDPQLCASSGMSITFWLKHGGELASFLQMPCANGLGSVGQAGKYIARSHGIRSHPCVALTLKVRANYFQSDQTELS